MAVTGTALNNALAPAGLNLITRAEWGARPREYLTGIQLPSPYFFVHHAAVESSDDAREVRAHQNYHMDVKGWSDIAYNFLVPDPNPNLIVFEGRGVGVQGGHTSGYNRTAHAVCVLGNFENTQPSANTLESVARLIKRGRNLRWWGTHVGGHSDVSTSSCPGRYLYAKLPWIRTRANALWSAAPAPIWHPAARPYPGPRKYGQENSGVAVWQQILNEFRWYRRRTDPNWYRLAVDGDYGPATNHIVEHAKRVFGITQEVAAGAPWPGAGEKLWHALRYR